ncbi:MAG: DNA (cytosine-5-)-methyltransferase [Candidatus Paceibacterota bacterium]|jgi:DNA (cytosine-5)-methyltransferase 1
MKRIRVVELFAGVGGFRVGLETATRNNGHIRYEVVWSSQWEPGASTQHASQIYEVNFGKDGHSNEDIQKIIDNKFHEIRDHDLLVGGFPCQDYSVARTLSQAKGLEGKKGVLWWSIYNILQRKGKKAPSFLLLENVDRLLKSPSVQRGRDFAVMLSSLNNLGYAVEWRVINAAEYGMPQRRRRVYILGYKKGTEIYKNLEAQEDKERWINKDGVTAKAFPVKNIVLNKNKFTLEKDLVKLTKNFSMGSPQKSPFEISGIMINGEVYTYKVTPDYDGKFIILKDIIEPDEKKIQKEFFIDKKDLPTWKYLKGGKKEARKSKGGFTYDYSEGSMVFPDSLEKPSRTIVTGEGGISPSRFKHVIKTKTGKLRRLTSEELERLNMFPEGHTKFMHNGKITPDTKRAFIMGNALVVGVIEGLGKALIEFINKKPKKGRMSGKRKKYLRGERSPQPLGEDVPKRLVRTVLVRGTYLS